MQDWTGKRRKLTKKIPPSEVKLILFCMMKKNIKWINCNLNEI